MRPDVKLGVVMSMVVVSVAGVYYLYRDKQEMAIPVAAGPAAVSNTLPPKTNEKPDSAVAKRDAEATRRLDAARKPAASRNQQQAKSGQSKSPVNRPVASKAQPGSKTVLPPGSRPNTLAKKRSAVPGAKTVRRRASDPLAGTAKTTTPTARKNPATSRPAGSSTTPMNSRTAQGPSSTRKRMTPPVAKRRAAVPKPSLTRTSKPTSAIADDFHRVQDGDTFSALSQRYYGSEGLSTFLIASNPQITDANRLRVGDSIRIPPRPARKTARGNSPRRSAPATAVPAQNTYTVKPGDSFYRIAKERLGDAARWKELFELNQDRVGHDPSRLAIGQVLILPKS